MKKKTKPIVYDMTPIHECVVIKDHRIAAMFSGQDVWLIPIVINDITGKWEPSPNPKEQPYVGDGWSIRNEGVVGYRGEPCWIAVESTDRVARSIYAGKVPKIKNFWSIQKEIQKEINKNWSK